MNAIFDTSSLLDVDQYEGTASKIWHMYIGDHKARTNSYRLWIRDILKSHGCERVLDAATGTGIDSEMLVEEGFAVTSVDNSKYMLAKAKELRSKRKSEPNFDRWCIYQANWLQLDQDLQEHGEMSKGLFDAVILLGNSFSHLPTEELQTKAIENFNKVLRPGGILIIDHRNYDVALNGERVSQTSNFYNGTNIEKVDTYMIAKNGSYIMVVLDYFIKEQQNGIAKSVGNGNVSTSKSASDSTKTKNFKLYFYPIALSQMKRMLKDHFKPSDSEVYGDFKNIQNEDQEHSKPSYYCHVVQK